MTCIVGLVNDGTVYIGGDSALTNGWRRRQSRPHKVFRLKGNGEEMLVGVTGSPRAQQILQYHLELPERESETDMRYLIVQFVPAVRAALKEHGLARVDSNEETYDSILLVGYRGDLYAVETNYQVVQVADSYTAIGAGAAFALGALHLAEETQFFVGAKARVMHALKAAARFNASVCEPFYVEEL